VLRSGPLQLVYRRFWIGAGYLLLVLTLTVSLLPIAADSQVFVVSDKLLHGLCFMLLMIWFCGTCHRSSYLRLGLWLLLFGGIIELLQYSTGYRSMELADLLADAAGLLAGGLLAWWGLGRWCELAEKLFNGSR
jgi:VanZ family protein